MNKHPRSIVRGGAGRFEHAKYSEARNPQEPRGSDMGTVWQDVRYALRNLKNAPGFALVAVLTLALGIGSSTAIFSVLDNVLMEPFPYPDAQRFMTMQIHDAARTEEGGRGAFKGPEYLDYVEQNHSFDRVIANDPVDVLYRSSEGTQLMRGNFVTPGTFEFLGMPALLGRALQPADYEAGAPPVFVLRYKTWANQFGGDAKILNQAFVLNGAARTLVGVMPPRFAWGNADLWIPEKPSRSVAEKAYSGSFPPFWSLLGHLKPGVSEEQAEADLSVVAQRLATAYPKDYPKHFTVEVLSLAGSVVGKFSRTLYLVLTAVALLLLIACGNVANLLLARATTREKEFAIRSAIGASRRRLIRQLLVESLVLALAGAALGMLLAWGGLKFLVVLMPPDTIPPEAVIHLNTPVLFFTLGVAIMTAIIFGLIPALSTARKDLNQPLRDSGKGVSGGSRHGRVRDVLVVLEVALSLTLLVAAGLLLRSFEALREVHLGLQPDHVLVARLPLPDARYHTAEQVTGFYRPLLQRIAALPGVVGAAETSAMPPYGGLNTDIEIPGRTHEEKWKALFQLCSDGYFPLLKLQLLDGRTFNEAEVNAARKVAVVNETFVRRYLPGENPLGKQVQIAQLAEFEDQVADPTFEIIGLVADAKNRGLQDSPDPEIWVPYTVTGSAHRGILVRTARDPLALMEAVRHEIWATDSSVAITLTGTLEGYINQFSYAGPRFGFTLVMVFGAIGLILVTIGVYSLLAYTTARRTQEMGIRIALGAQRGDVLGMVVRAGLRLVGLGVAIGILASLALGRVIEAELWGVSAYDPLTLACVSLLLVVTGLVACRLPARRASRVDPLVALRYE